VARRPFDPFVTPACERALEVGVNAPVLGAHDVGRRPRPPGDCGRDVLQRHARLWSEPVDGPRGERRADSLDRRTVPRSEGTGADRAGTGPGSAGSSVLPSGGSNDSSMGGSTSAAGTAPTAGTAIVPAGGTAAGGMSTGGDAGSAPVAGTSAGGTSAGGSGPSGGPTKGPTAGCGKPAPIIARNGRPRFCVSEDRGTPGQEGNIVDGRWPRYSRGRVRA